MNGSTQYFNLYHTPGFSPDGNAVMWVYDNFSSSNLDTSKWTVYKEGSSNAIVTIQNGQLILSGAGVTSSANVVLNKPFTNGIELAVNEVLIGGTRDAGTYSDASFGSGALVGGRDESDSWQILIDLWHRLFSFLGFENSSYIDSSPGRGWWHTMFSTVDGSFQSQGISRSMIWVNSSTSDAIMPNPGIMLSDYTGENLSHTVAYGYDAYGNANMNILNVNQNRLPLSVPDPYGFNQFNHPDVYYNATGLFGHKWWMLITPLKNSNSKYENPCLYYSDDGLLWYVPPEVTNPIAKPIISEYDSNAYESDPDLVYNPATGKLMCYYVTGEVVGNVTVEDPKVRTYDGSTISPEMNVSAHGVSPSILYDGDSRTFYMWIVDIDPYPNVIYRYTSTDGVNFYNKQAVEQSSDYEIWHTNVMNRPGDSKLYALFTFVGNDNLYLATANNYTDIFTVQDIPLLQVNESSSSTHKDIQLYRSAGVFSEDGNLLKLWIPARDSNGDWTIFYTQATQVNSVWRIGNFTTLRAPVTAEKNIQYINTSKQWMLSQGDSTNNNGVTRKISEVWGYKTGHTPKINVTNNGAYTQIEVVSTDSQDLPYYQVMIPANMLNISSQNDSLDIEHVQTKANTYPSDGIIYWNGQNWYLSGGRTNPGNNSWNTSGAWIDNQNRMHLTIVNDSGNWKCTMLNSQYVYLYGTFTWTVASPIYTFDKNSVIGLCTYLDDYHELALGTSRWGATSRWGKTRANQLWYFGQPFNIEENNRGYLVPLSIEGTNTTYRIDWKPDYARFTTMQTNGKIIADYNYTNVTEISQKPESIVMNLWLITPPSDGKNIELIISDFNATNYSIRKVA